MKKTLIALMALSCVAPADMVICDLTNQTQTYGTYDDITFISTGAITTDYNEAGASVKTATLNGSVVTFTTGTGSGSARGMLGTDDAWDGGIPVDLGISSADISKLCSSGAYIQGDLNNTTQYPGYITLTISGLSAGYYNISALAAKETGGTSNITMSLLIDGTEWSNYSTNSTYYTYSNGSWGTASQGKPTFGAVSQSTPSGAYANFEYIYIDKDDTTVTLKLTGTPASGTNTKALQFVTIESIPEPTTATLSLLALAGLAARRRRR